MAASSSTASLAMASSVMDQKASPSSQKYSTPIHTLSGSCTR